MEKKFIIKEAWALNAKGEMIKVVSPRDTDLQKVDMTLAEGGKGTLTLKPKMKIQ